MPKFEAKSFSERLSFVLKNESVNSFAERAGIKEGSIRQYLSGSTPGIDKASLIAATAGVSLDWLINGDSPVSVGESQTTKSPQDFAYIPRLDITASAGNGSVAVTEHPDSMLAFQASWLRRRGINPSTASALTASGDSMEPTIRDGDTLLIDKSIDQVRDNGIYVVVIGGLVVVKRVHMSMDGSITLLSENSIYPPEKVRAEEVNDLIFAGRVMWFGRSI